MVNDELYHFGVKGMKWGVRKKYQSAARSLGGSRFAKNAIKNSRHLDANGKRQALDQQAYLAAKKKSKKTGGQITYDVSTGKYSVDKGNKQKMSAKKKAAIAAGITAVASALAIYGGYKVSEYIKSEAGHLVFKQGFDYYTKNKTLWEDEPYLHNKVTNSVKEAAKYLYQNRK